MVNRGSTSTTPEPILQLQRVMRKFKRFKHHTVQASQFLQKLAKERVDLFVHWRIAVAGTFA